MKILVTLTALAIGATAAQAATLDVSSLPDGFQGATSVTVPQATISTPDGDDLFFNGADGSMGSFCAINAGTCEADLEIDFSMVIENVMFTVGGFDPGDSVLLNIFDASDALAGTLAITAPGGYDISAFGEVGRLLFDDMSTGAGVAYNNFTFDVVDGMDVPAPAAGLLMLFGIAGLGARRAYRK
ncbi:MAG: hypothetical protein WA979_00540 [Pacificimonas sp.]